MKGSRYLLLLRLLIFFQVFELIFHLDFLSSHINMLWHIFREQGPLVARTAYNIPPLSQTEEKNAKKVLNVEMWLPLWSVLMLRQHSVLRRWSAYTPTHTGFVKNNGPFGWFLTKPANNIHTTQTTNCLILHSTWCTLLCNAYPSISLCCAFASAALKPSCKPLGWFCSTSSAASSLNQQSTHSGAKRVFKSRFGSSGLFCCQKNNTQDWLSLSFFAVWAWAAVKVRVCGWAALLTSTTVCPLPVCLYGRWWNPTHFTYQTSAHELRVH